MKLQTEKFKFELLTPCFSGTAYGGQEAEIRVPPIRGHIRQWHRALFRNEDTNKVWGSASKSDKNSSHVEGSTSNDSQHSSLVGIRLVNVDKVKIEKSPILPHKNGGGGTRLAIQPETVVEFELVRLVGCSNPLWEHAIKATKLWLLLGGLGARVNRAAGSVYPIGDWVPKDKEQFKKFLSVTLELENHSIALIGYGKNHSAEDLRKVASDTIKGNLRNVFGSPEPRQPSPTKFKVFRFDNVYCLLAIAPKKQIYYDRTQKNTPIIDIAENELKEKARWKNLGKWEILL